MVEVTKEELKLICGGKAGVWASIGVVLGVLGTLFAGILDGYLRPLGCNK